jgi:hypothetical protein
MTALSFEATILTRNLQRVRVSSCPYSMSFISSRHPMGKTTTFTIAGTTACCSRPLTFLDLVLSFSSCVLHGLSYATRNFRFLKTNQFTYAISVLDPTTGEHKIEHTKSKMVKPILFASLSRTRSVSPQKRKLSEVTDSDLGTEEDTDEDDGRDDEFRGRTRWRGVSYHIGTARNILSPYSRPSSAALSDNSKEQVRVGSADRLAYHSPPADAFSATTVDGGRKCLDKRETSGVMPSNKRMRIA